MTRTRRAWRAAAAVVVTLAPIVLHALPSSAGAAPSIALVAQDPWTRSGGDVRLTLNVEGAEPGAAISVVAHQPMSSRSAFDATLDDDPQLGSFADQVVVPVAALPIGTDGNRNLTLQLEDFDAPRLAETLGARRPGVYPLEIELRNANDETLAGFVTYLVVISPGGTEEATTNPLGVAWMWTIGARPATLPGDGPDPAVVAQLEPDGRLGRQVAALDRTAGVPVTIVPGPETLDAWTASAGKQSIANGVLALRGALATHQVLASTYVPVDLPSLLHANMTPAVDALLPEGDEALRRFFGTRIDPRTALARPIDAASLGRLRNRGVDRLIVETDALTDEGEARPDGPFLLAPPPSLLPAGPVVTLAADSDLARLLDTDAAPALRAQQLLAGLSVMAFDETDGEPRAVAIANPAGLDPPEALIDAVLNGLRANPLLTPMTVETVFEQSTIDIRDEDAETRSLAAYDPPAPPVPALAYEAARNRLASAEAFAPEAEGLEAADRALLASVSSAWGSPDDGGRPEAELASIDAFINALLARIEVPNPSTITLTDRGGDIPLTFRNDTEQTVSILIEFQSPKLSFPDGTEQIIELQPLSTTVRIAVESRTSGSFPLRVTVTSVDRVLTIAQAQLEVQATEVSAVGLVLLISAAVFLALWWMLHIHRERVRKRRPAALPEPAT